MNRFQRMLEQDAQFLRAVERESFRLGIWLGATCGFCVGVIAASLFVLLVATR